MNTTSASRRAVLAAAGATPLALSLAACGGSGGGASPDTGEEPTMGETGKPGEQAEPDDAGALAQTSEIPQGGGKVLESEKVVVTQPAAGEFKAYSAVCRHQGCLVSSVSDGTINCACHGSRYDIQDGSVTRGPATRALPEVDISVKGGAIRRS